MAVLVVALTACGAPASRTSPAPGLSGQPTEVASSPGTPAPIAVAEVSAVPTANTLDLTPTPFRVLPSPSLAQLADEAHVHVGSQIVWCGIRDYPLLPAYTALVATLRHYIASKAAG